MRRCNNCKWYLGNMKSDGKTIGRCHYYPPEGFVTSSGFFGYDRVEFQFRVVKGTDFCSKWTAEGNDIRDEAKENQRWRLTE